MFCEYCGTPIENNAAVCPKCGRPVAEDDFARAGNAGAAVNAGMGEPYTGAGAGNPDTINTGNTMGMDSPYMGAGAPGGNPGMGDPYAGAGMRGGNAGYVPPNPNPGPNPYGQRQSNQVVTARSVGNRVSDLILADGEIVVRQYKCADFSKASGYLTVTNKRVMFHAVGDNSRLSQEVGLPSVSGLRSYYGTNYDTKKILLGVLVGIVGIIIMVSMGGLGIGPAPILMGLVLLLVGAFLIILGIERSFLIAVYAKDVTRSPIVVGQGPTSLAGNSALYAFNTMRNQETDQMLNELGAMIQDLQTLGDYAIEKWKSDNVSGGSGFSSLPNL